MTTDITELAQSKALHKKLNRRLNDAFGFQRTSGGKHTTISLSIEECKSVIAAFDERLALVEALEKAQQRIDSQREYYEGVIADGGKRIAELESRTVKLPDFRHERFNSDWGEHDAEAYQVALREALTAAGIKVEAE